MSYVPGTEDWRRASEQHAGELMRSIWHRDPDLNNQRAVSQPFLTHALSGICQVKSHEVEDDDPGSVSINNVPSNPAQDQSEEGAEDPEEKPSQALAGCWGHADRYLLDAYVSMIIHAKLSEETCGSLSSSLCLREARLSNS